MVPFKVNDDSPGFIQIKVSDTNSEANTITKNEDTDPQFQKVLSELLQSLSGSTNEQEPSANLESLTSRIGNLKGNNLSALNQLLQASTLTPDQSGNDPLTDFANAQMIAKYKIAMANFEKAMQMSPGSFPGLDLEDLSRLSKGVLKPEVKVSDIQETTFPGLNPSKGQVAEYIINECKEIGLPEQLGLATAMTESEMTQFNKDGTPFRHGNFDSTDWGIMQINDKAWGDQYDLNLVKTDWKYNVRAGLQILKHSYDAAMKSGEGLKGPGDVNQNLVRAAYSGYNAGSGNVWRYRIPVQEASRTGLYDVIDNQGFDMRDIRFWDNYRKFS
jgi:hypothetical protein